MEEDKKTLFAKVCKCLALANWTYMTSTDQSSIILFYQTDVACLRLHLIIKEPQQHLILMVTFERRCPEKYKKTMAEYCCHINDAVPIGIIAVDMNDGEVRIRHSVDVEGIEITPKFIDNFLKSVLQLGRKYYEPIQLIMFGYSLEKAIAQEQS